MSFGRARKGRKGGEKCITGANVSYSRRNVNLTSKVQAERLKMGMIGRKSKKNRFMVRKDGQIKDF